MKIKSSFIGRCYRLIRHINITVRTVSDKYYGFLRICIKRHASQYEQRNYANPIEIIWKFKFLCLRKKSCLYFNWILSIDLLNLNSKASESRIIRFFIICQYYTIVLRILTANTVVINILKSVCLKKKQNKDFYATVNHRFSIVGLIILVFKRREIFILLEMKPEFIIIFRSWAWNYLYWTNWLTL